MKKIFAILTIFLICTIGKTATDSNNTIMPDSNNTAVPDTNTTADCLEKIKQLEQVIESQEKRLAKITDAFNNLKKQLDEQIKENERLKALLPKDKPNSVEPATNFDPNNGIAYRGKKRNKQWFNQMYTQFRDKIYLNHEHQYKFLISPPKSPQYEYVDVLSGGELRKNVKREIPQYIQLGSEHIGSVGQLSYGGTVIDVIKKGEILIASKAPTHIVEIIHIYGLDRDFYVSENFLIGQWFINVGFFKVNTGDWVGRTCPNLTPYRPLTKEQFAEAINSGFELTGIK